MPEGDLLVPIEIVCPPVPMTDLEVLTPAVAGLRAAGAAGTEDSLIAAYGVHINCEIPHLEASTLNNYLRAFALLQWWLVETHKVDFSRKLSPFIGLFSDGYLKCLLSRRDPDLATLLEDYLQYNPTRNRALDLLPLLATLDPARVAAAVNDNRVSARPAFHYRLPDCHIDKSDWSLAKPWNSWWVVEELAARPEALTDLGAEFLARQRPLWGVNRNHWTELMDRWLTDHALA